MEGKRSSRLRIGLVGCGEVTVDKHLPALRRVPEIEVAAVADPNTDARERVASKYGISNSCESVEQLLADYDVAAVGVCVPPAQHVAVTLAAIAAGKHVLVEKPLALCADDAECLLSRAHGVSTLALMGFHMRWHRLVRQGRALLRSGAIGEVESVHSTWSSPRDDVGLPSWRARREHGGGALVEIAVHHIDLWRYLLDREVEEVFARSRHGVRDDEAAEVDAVLEGGVLASLSLSERAPHQIEIELRGSRGRLRIDCLRFDGLETYDALALPGSPRTRAVQVAHSVREMPSGVLSRRGSDYLDSYRGEWAHFAAAIQRGDPIESTLDDGLRALNIVVAATESASARRPVMVSEAPPRIRPARS